MLIIDGTVITLGASSRVIESGAIFIRGDKIAEIGTTRALEKKYPNAERLNAHGKIVMPGAIVSHTHFYGAFARGMSLPAGPPPKNFPEILRQLWWKIDRALTLDDCRLSALVCLVDAIRNGTTTLIDHHASPRAIDGSLDAIADAVLESGLRASLCYEVTDRNGAAGAKAGIRENVRFIKQTQDRSRLNNRITASFGVHASFTVSDKTLDQCLDATDGLGSGFHIHVAEDAADEDDALLRFKLRVGERLAQRGVFGPKTIAAHCVQVDAGEIELLHRTKTNVAHNARSNMNNAVGVADVLGMMRRGINVGLGNDGFTNNQFAEMKTAYLLHKSARRDPRVMGADQVLQMAYANNAKIAQVFWKPPVGELSVGAFADIVLLDYVPYTPLTAGNFPWHLIFGMDGTHVTHTICAGKLLMRDRELLTLDEAAIAAEAREAAKKVWKRVMEIR